MASLLDIISEAQSENALQLGKIFGEKKAIAEDTIKVSEDAAPSSLAISAQASQGALQAQDNSIAARQAMGNDISDPNSLMAILVQDFRDNTLAAREQYQSIAEKKQVGLFDDPLQFLVNQVLLPDEINAYNATAQKADFAKTKIAELQSLTTATAQAQQATAQKLTASSVKDQLKVDSAAMAVQLNQLKMASLGYDEAAIKATRQANTEMMQVEMHKLSMYYQAQNESRAAGQYNWLMNERKDQATADANEEAIINAGAAQLGLPSLTMEQIAKTTKFGSPQEKMAISAMRSQGLKLAQAKTLSPDAPTPTIGDSPGEAWLISELTGGLRDATHAQAKKFLDEISKDAAQRTIGSTKKGVDRLKEISETMDEILYGPADPKTGKRNIRQGRMWRLASDVETEGNILKAMPLDQLVKLPSIQANPLFKSVFEPAVAAGVTLSDPKTVMSLLDAAQQKEGFSDNMWAMSMAQFYSAATAANYAYKGLSKLGLPYHPSYVASVPSSSPYARTEQRDMAKPESMLSYKIMRDGAAEYTNRGQ